MTAAVPATTAAQAEGARSEFNPQVASSSRFLDPVWSFERWNRARTTGHLRIDWRQRFDNGALLTDPPYAVLLQVGRELVYLLMNAPPDGRRRHRATSAINVAEHVFAFFRWVTAQGYTRLADVDPEAISRYRAWVLTRRAHSGRPLAPSTTARYLIVALDLHRYRDRLSDGLVEHPFHGMELDEILGSLAPTGEIPHIPMDIAVPFLLLAVRWVREHGPEIADALEHSEEAYARAAANGKDASICAWMAMRSLRRFRFEHPPLIDGRRSPENVGLLQLRRLVRFSITASFIVVAALTGMRLSELLSLEENCLERLPLEDGSEDCLLYVRGVLVKTAGTPSGELVRWVAGVDGPHNHVRAAIELVRRLTSGLRKGTGGTHLFLTIALREGKRRPDTPGGHTINWRLNTYARAVGTARPWRFSCHQFRKTFARFVAMGDKSGLLALKQHFKHVSIAMTDRYVGRDLELLDLVATEQQQQLGQALDELIGAECLAGKLGEQIVARNQRFRGRAGDEVRREYVKMVLEETDLVILPHEYGYCVYRAEVARCGGTWARVGLSTCIGCSNFAVGPSHVPFWERRRDDGMRLLGDLETLPGREPAVIAIRDMIAGADAVLARIHGQASEA